MLKPGEDAQSRNPTIPLPSDLQPAQSELPQILHNGGGYYIMTNNSSFVSIKDESGVSSQKEDAAQIYVDKILPLGTCNHYKKL